ncbi:hypothetical protein AK822_13715 [Psychrobacter sp. P11F6]|nr:hypothetical protein AK822_13715 [Psychrobacter sp. P11F6]
MEQIKHVTVLSKIPKNSIRVAISDSGTYSSDFSYVVEIDKSQTLNLIIETKDTASPESRKKPKN